MVAVNITIKEVVYIADKKRVRLQEFGAALGEGRQ